jgi:hypothetical protein
MSDTLSTAKHLHVHVIYEYGSDYRPYSSSFLRLIRPLTHPRVREDLSVSFGLDYHNEPADIVILDRLWRGDITLNLAEELINKIRLNGSRFVYSLDDNYLDLPSSSQNVRADELVRIVTLLLRQADGVLVTTPALRQRLQQYNPNIQILPNRLLPTGTRDASKSRLLVWSGMSKPKVSCGHCQYVSFIPARKNMNTRCLCHGSRVTSVGISPSHPSYRIPLMIVNQMSSSWIMPRSVQPASSASRRPIQAQCTINRTVGWLRIHPPPGRRLSDY